MPSAPIATETQLRPLELSKSLLLLLCCRSGNLEQVELDRLGQRAALSHDDLVTQVDCRHALSDTHSCNRILIAYSPRKAGLTWTGSFECLRSYRLYFGT